MNLSDAPDNTPLILNKRIRPGIYDKLILRLQELQAIKDNSALCLHSAFKFQYIQAGTWPCGDISNERLDVMLFVA